MAKEKTYPAIANQYIKYGGEYIEQGEEFEVKASDIEELKQFAKISIPESGQEGEKEGE